MFKENIFPVNFIESESDFLESLELHFTWIMRWLDPTAEKEK